MALRNLRLTILGLLIIQIGLSIACKNDTYDLPYAEDCENYDYYDCNTTEPQEASMFLNFSINSQVEFVVFDVFKGYTDDDNLFFTDSCWTSQIEYYMPVNQYYSVRATYHIDGKTIKVIDGDELKTKSAKVCDSTCWSVNTLDLNLTLK